MPDLRKTPGDEHDEGGEQHRRWRDDDRQGEELRQVRPQAAAQGPYDGEGDQGDDRRDDFVSVASRRPVSGTTHCGSMPLKRR
jgi:hypothetical protein